MTIDEAVNYINVVIQDYIKSVEGNSPGAAYALAHTSNVAVALIRQELMKHTQEQPVDIEKEPE